MQQREEQFTLYTLLNVAPKATQNEIKKSYRQLALQLHPDKNQADVNAKEKFQKISEAYQILSNEEKRKMYDETGMIEGMDEFKNAYEFYRNLYPKISREDIDKYEVKYRFSKEEENDLIEFYNKQDGNVKCLLENIILSKNEDIPRFLEFYDEMIKQKKIADYKIYQTSRNKIKTLREDPEAQQIDMDQLTKQIRQRPKNTFDQLLQQMEQKYQKPKKVKSQKK
ncbi:unnamed protein product (macronuclear) [Paramecium tetraurelia]|uniref:J domain-containing protein n=1 Tax=Paramecium tetraurelia TaxID=5888 RepID=A0BRZ1_PARTE|nr:uncharacterized protein GSPATT00031539001 [Paramecium tetraurelia]CAK61308.1 unnamed protein product [Paramecium tetraurelia]|eukprot:XP_001428706.1 hypothetical protein (macronuclear) [Paramecium tetraurelia strain d4-2]